MHHIRRSALRALSSAPRAINTTSTTPFALRVSAQKPSLISAFKRFNSTEISSATEAKEVANEQTKVDEQDAKVAATEEVKQEYAFGAAPRREARQGGYVKDGAYGDRSSLRPPPPPSNTVYVGNLVFDMTSGDLAAEFQDVGKVVSAVVAEDARGLSKGFGYVEFEDIPTATAAIAAKNQSNARGRRLIVNYRTKTTRREVTESVPAKTLFIGNLAFEMSDADLNKLFRDVRNVIDVRVAIDRRTGQPRGFAHADFVDVDSAKEAMKFLQGKEIYGRTLRVDYAAQSSSSQTRSNNY